MAKYELRVDLAKNRLYMTLDGFLGEEETKNLERDFYAAVDQLKPGFDLINDLRTFIPGSAHAAEAIRRGADYVKKKGMGHSVRVVSGMILGIMQFKRMLAGKLDSVIVRTVEEAEAKLDALHATAAPRSDGF